MEKKEILAAYAAAFTLFAIAGSVMAFISGIDAVFDNPFGLLMASIFLGILSATIIVGGFGIFHLICPAKAEQFFKKELAQIKKDITADNSDKLE